MIRSSRSIVWRRSTVSWKPATTKSHRNSRSTESSRLSREPSSRSCILLRRRLSDWRSKWGRWRSRSTSSPRIETSWNKSHQISELTTILSEKYWQATMSLSRTLPSTNLISNSISPSKIFAIQTQRSKRQCLSTNRKDRGSLRNCTI